MVLVDGFRWGRVGAATCTRVSAATYPRGCGYLYPRQCGYLQCVHVGPSRAARYVGQGSKGAQKFDGPVHRVLRALRPFSESGPGRERLMPTIGVPGKDRVDLDRSFVSAIPETDSGTFEKWSRCG